LKKSIVIIGGFAMASTHLGYYFTKYFNQIGINANLILKESYLSEWVENNPGKNPKDDPLITIIPEKKGEPKFVKKLREINEIRKYDYVLSIAAGGLWYLPSLRKPYIAYSTGADLGELAAGIGYKGKQVNQTRKFFKKAKLVFYGPEKSTIKMIDELKIKTSIPWRQVFDMEFWTQEKNEKKGNFLNIFNPSNQQWIEKFPNQRSKGNDIFFKGFKKFLDTGGKGKAFYVKRGQNLKDTEELIKKLDLEEHTEILDQLDSPYERKERMKKMDVVADQFGEDLYGLITLESLSMKIPVITEFSKEKGNMIFLENEKPPPILNANTAEQISEKLHNLSNFKQYNLISEESRNWNKKYHEPKKLVKWYWNHIIKNIKK